MRHVSDGELHAFLDGAADLLPAGRGEEVRNHIAECLSCRERLQDEETVRSQARDILGGPDLGEFELPTFEELRERAEASGPDIRLRADGEGEEKPRYRGPLKGVPLAWAATIVLALGVGWMGNQVFSTIPPGSRARPSMDTRMQESPEASSMDPIPDRLRGEEAQSSRVDAEVSPSAEGSEPSGDVTRAETDADVVRDPTDPNLVSDSMVITASRRNDGLVVAPATVAVSPTGRQPPASLVEQQQARTQVEAEAADRKAVEGLREKVPEELLSVTDSSGAMPSFALNAGAAAGGLARERSVVDSLENTLAVPGLRVVSIGWEERESGEKALLIRQLLSPGDTLELRYLGLLLGTDPEVRRQEGREPVEEAPGLRAYANVLEASLPPGWNQVVMERGRGLLVARGPIEADQLKALLKILH